MDQKLKQEFREILRRFYQVGNMKHIYQLQCNSALVDVIKGFRTKCNLYKAPVCQGCHD